MADHAKHTGHAPIGHCLGHDVGDRARARGKRWDADIDAIIAYIDIEHVLTGILMPARRLAGQRVEVPAMPWAAQPAFALDALFNRTFTERPALVRTLIVHGGVLTLKVHQRH